VTLGAALTNAKPEATAERERRNECVFEKNDFDFLRNYRDGKKSKYSDRLASVLIENKQEDRPMGLALKFKDP
jgi:hypothetical protein